MQTRSNTTERPDADQGTVPALPPAAESAAPVDGTISVDSTVCPERDTCTPPLASTGGSDEAAA
jgi:hypothetical protein